MTLLINDHTWYFRTDPSELELGVFTYKGVITLIFLLAHSVAQAPLCLRHLCSTLCKRSCYGCP